MRIVKPYFLPQLIATPDHEIYATPDPSHVPVGKLKVSELREGWFLAVPKLNSFESDDEIVVAGELGTKAPLYRKSTKITPAKAGTILRLRRRAATSSQIADSVGLTASYVRKIAPKLERDGVTDRLFWTEDSLVDRDAYIHYKMEKRPYIPNRIKLTQHLAQLLGYYCAEGFVTKIAGRPNSYRLLFSFGKHELKLAKTTEKIMNNCFGVSPQLVKRESTITVESGKRTLALLFAKLCGAASHEKRVPSVIISAKRNIVKAFLMAYVEGDGCATGNTISTNTVSLKLAMGICWLFLRAGVLPRFYEYKPVGHKGFGQRTIKQSKLYYVKVPLDTYRRNVLEQNVAEIPRRCKLYEEDGNYFYLLIRRVTDSHYTGPVFNLETSEESHSYLANFVSVGNCQNWDISQHPDAGVPISAAKLSLIIKSLRSEGAANINFVGGEPTPNLHVILESLNLTSVNVPILWNSNMYLTPEAMQILSDVVDIWLPDFKWGNDRCAVKYSRIVRYFDVTSRNHAMAYQNGDVIIRHLVMPGHVECCSKPILDWIAENCPRALVNVMSQYRPEHLVLREPEKYSEIACRPSTQELKETRDYADRLDIVWKPVS
jgi:pyruvate-formate lyase-activating enzyme/intein/homing endonuclease